MCRLFGLTAGTVPVRATFWLLDAPDSLEVQSHRNADGSGIGFFDPAGTPVLDKQPEPAYSDEEFIREARQAEAILENGEAKNLPPALIIQGTADNNVTPDMPDRFVAAYTKAGGRITLRKFEGEPHTFISQNPTKPASVEALGLITDFIREQTR